MTTPVEMINDANAGEVEPDLGGLDRSSAIEDDSSEINDRRARLESAETLRLVRAL